MSGSEEKSAKHNVPKLRFPGFTDPWEQRKLGEMATFGKGFGFSKSDFAEDGEQLFHYGRLYTDYECVVRSVDTHAAPQDGAVFSTGGEVVAPSSGETAEDIAIASAIVSPGIMLGGGLNIIRPCSQLDPVFLALSISSGQQHYDLARRAQGKSIVHLYNDDLAKSSLEMPRQIKEQRAIGQFFESFDRLITLRQREPEQTKDADGSAFAIGIHSHWKLLSGYGYSTPSSFNVSAILASNSAISRLSSSSRRRTSSRSISSSSSNVST